MKNAFPVAVAALLFSVFTSSALPQDSVAVPNPAASLADLNDAVAFLAGIELPHQRDHPLTATEAWKSHVAQFGKDFVSHQERVLFPMSEWAATEISPLQPPGGVVRYLFSGPDILHAFHLFPAANTYLMCGLEPVGQAPDITALNEGNIAQALGEMRNALGESIQFSFFRTIDMKEDLKFATFQGTTPLMMIFLARSHQYVKELEFLTLQQDGTLLSQGTNHTGANVVRLVFSPRRLLASKTLYYFSSDLSDGGFEKSGFSNWLSAQPKGNAYLKAASFLLHDNWFSKVRQHLLDHSNQIVQDDSGIPLRYFDAETWYGSYYGVYTGPISLFPNSFQNELATAYADGALPLPFGTGYKWRKGESNLMRFVRKNLPALPRGTPVEIPKEVPIPEVVTPTTATAPTVASEKPEKTSE